MGGSEVQGLPLSHICCLWEEVEEDLLLYNNGQRQKVTLHKEEQLSGWFSTLGAQNTPDEPLKNINEAGSGDQALAVLFLFFFFYILQMILVFS